MGTCGNSGFDPLITDRIRVFTAQLPIPNAAPCVRPVTLVFRNGFSISAFPCHIPLAVSVSARKGLSRQDDTLSLLLLSNRVQSAVAEFHGKQGVVSCEGATIITHLLADTASIKDQETVCYLTDRNCQGDDTRLEPTYLDCCKSAHSSSFILGKDW